MLFFKNYEMELDCLRNCPPPHRPWIWLVSGAVSLSKTSAKRILKLWWFTIISARYDARKIHSCMLWLLNGPFLSILLHIFGAVWGWRKYAMWRRTSFQTETWGWWPSHQSQGTVSWFNLAGRCLSSPASPGWSQTCATDGSQWPSRKRRAILLFMSSCIPC